MSDDITIRNSNNQITINNSITEAGRTVTARIPPNAPLDFGTLSILFNNMVPQSSAPSGPSENDVYVDDGTNTASGTLGFRRYSGSTWEDFGLQSAAGVFAIGDLSDVTISSIADGERLVYNAVSGEWENVETIDGGTF